MFGDALETAVRFESGRFESERFDKERVSQPKKRYLSRQQIVLSKLSWRIRST